MVNIYMKSLSKIILFLLLSFNIYAQTWLTPKPNTTFPNNQSVYFQTTNLFLTSFFLGGSNGASGYFIWNGQRYDDISDLAVAVSNSLAPTSIVLKIDFNSYTNTINNELISITNAIRTETTNRIASDAGISNALTFVPTNAVISYVSSTTNFISWSNTNKTWYFVVCLTNGQGAGGSFSSTNIINVSNSVVAGTTYITNFFNITNASVSTLNSTNLTQINFFNPTTIGTNNGISSTNRVVIEDPSNPGNVITQQWIFINGLRTQ